MTRSDGMFGGSKKKVPKVGKAKLIATLGEKDHARLANQFRLCRDARIVADMLKNSYDALWLEFKGRYDLGDNVGSVDMNTGEVFQAEGPEGHSGVVEAAPPMGKDG